MANGDQNKKQAKKASSSKQKAKREYASKAFGAAQSAAKATKGNRRSNRAKKQSALVFVVVILLCLVCGLYYFDIPPLNFTLGNLPKYQKPSEPILSEGTLKIHFIDVGQGDSIFLQFPDGTNMLIDGGKNRNDVAEAILTYLNQLSVTRIDTLMLTHTDEDHCGSLDNVIASEIYVANVWMPKIKSLYENDPLKDETKLPNGSDITVKETAVYRDFVKAVVEEGSKIHYTYEGDTLVAETKDYQFAFYTPNDELYSKISTAADKNNVSPIGILTFNGKKVCFTGDGDKADEQAFLKYTSENGIDTDVDVLKVGHHGGQESTNQDFLDAVRPEYSVISVGAGNSYGHPRPALLERLSNIGSEVYRTDLNGNIVLTITKEGLSWQTEKEQSAGVVAFPPLQRGGVFALCA